MPDEPGSIVARGYDALVDRYLAWTDQSDDDPRMRFLGRLAAELPDGADVLELGCGAGVPATARLAERFAVTGVDVSPAQVERARSNVPGATFRVADVTDFDVSEATFDGVAAFYVLGHVPRERLGRLLVRIASWLRPGGWFAASFGAADHPGGTSEWLGVPMYFSSFPPPVNRELVERAGLEVMADELVTAEEDGYGAVTFHWLLARRPYPERSASVGGTAAARNAG